MTAPIRPPARPSRHPQRRTRASACRSAGLVETRRVAQHRGEDRGVGEAMRPGRSRTSKPGWRRAHASWRRPGGLVVLHRPRPQQDGRRMDGPCADDDLVGATSPSAVRTPTALFSSNSTRSTSTSPRTTRLGRSGRFEVGVVRRDSATVPQGQGRSADTRGTRSVVVVADRVAEIAHRVAQRPSNGHSCEGLPRAGSDRPAVDPSPPWSTSSSMLRKVSSISAHPQPGHPSCSAQRS